MRNMKNINPFFQIRYPIIIIEIISVDHDLNLAVFVMWDQTKVYVYVIFYQSGNSTVSYFSHFRIVCCLL